HHGVVIGALTFVEAFQLCVDVAWNLGGESGQGGSAFSGRAVAAGTGGHTTVLVATLIDVLAHGRELRFFGGRGLRGHLFVVLPERQHFVWRELGDHVCH